MHRERERGERERERERGEREREREREEREREREETSIVLRNTLTVTIGTLSYCAKCSSSYSAGS